MFIHLRRCYDAVGDMIFMFKIDILVTISRMEYFIPIKYSSLGLLGMGNTQLCFKTDPSMFQDRFSVIMILDACNFILLKNFQVTNSDSSC